MIELARTLTAPAQAGQSDRFPTTTERNKAGQQPLPGFVVAFSGGIRLNTLQSAGFPQEYIVYSHFVLLFVSLLNFRSCRRLCTL